MYLFNSFEIFNSGTINFLYYMPDICSTVKRQGENMCKEMKHSEDVVGHLSFLRIICAAFSPERSMPPKMGPIRGAP